MTSQNKAYLKDVMTHYFKTYGGELIDSYLREPSPNNLAIAATRAITLDSRRKGGDLLKLNDFLEFGTNSIGFRQRTLEEYQNELANYSSYKRVSKFIYNYDDNPNPNTSIKNVEFLAWLSGFEPRPCSEHEREHGDKNKVSFKLNSSYHPKQNLLAEQIFKNSGLIETFMTSALNDIIEAYDLNKNEDFVKLRNEVGDDILLINLSMAHLQQKATSLRRRKRNIDIIKKYFGAFGLIFVIIKPSNYSIHNFFNETYQNLVDFGIEDFFEDFDESIEDL